MVCGNKARLVSKSKKTQKTPELFEKEGLKTNGKRYCDVNIKTIDIGKSTCHKRSDFFFKMEKPSFVFVAMTGIILFDKPVARARASGNSRAPYLKMAKICLSPL